VRATNAVFHSDDLHEWVYIKGILVKGSKNVQYAVQKINSYTYLGKNVVFEIPHGKPHWGDFGSIRKETYFTLLVEKKQKKSIFGISCQSSKSYFWNKKYFQLTQFL